MTLPHIPDIGARQLAAVLAVAEYRSFIAAASALQTSQPALSRTIKRVEDVLGVQIFERSTRRVRPTAAGEEFLAVARRMADDLRLTVRSMRELADQQRGQVIVTSIMSVANSLLPDMVAAYRRDRPGIEIQVRDGVHGSVNEDVRSGVADFGINYLADTAEAIEATPLGREVFQLVAPRDHALTQRGDGAVVLADVAGVPLVSMPSDSQTRRILDGAAAARSLSLEHAVVVSQFPTMINFVRAGVGVGIAPSSVSAGPLGEDLARLTLTNPDLALDIGIVRLSGRELTPAATGLLNAVVQTWPD